MYIDKRSIKTWEVSKHKLEYFKIRMSSRRPIGTGVLEREGHHTYLMELQDFKVVWGTDLV